MLTPISPIRPIFLTSTIIYVISDVSLCQDRRGTYLVGGLGDIGLEHQGLLDFVQQSLGLVESGRVDAGCSSASFNERMGGRLTIETLGNSLLDGLYDVLVLEVDSDDLGAHLGGHCQSRRNGIDSEDLGSTLEKGPLDTTELVVSFVHADFVGLHTPIGPRLGMVSMVLSLVRVELTPKHRRYRPSRPWCRRRRGKRWGERPTSLPGSVEPLLPAGNRLQRACSSERVSVGHGDKVGHTGNTLGDLQTVDLSVGYSDILRLSTRPSSSPSCQPSRYHNRSKTLSYMCP